MGEILKFPAPASKFGFKRVKKRPASAAESSGQLQLAFDGAAQILDFTPDSGWFAQALLWDERGDSKAGDLYKKAIDAGECLADAYCNLGIIESQGGQATKAFDCFTTSLKHDPRHAEAHYNLANLYFDLDELRLAQVHYEMAAELDPTFANVHFNLALVHAIKNELTASVQALTKYKELASEAEGQNADELLHELRKSLRAAGGARQKPG